MYLKLKWSKYINMSKQSMIQEYLKALKELKEKRRQFYFTMAMWFFF